MNTGDRRVSLDRKSWASFYEAVTQLELSGRGEYLMDEPIMFGRPFTQKPLMSFDVVATGEEKSTGSEIRMWGTSVPYEPLWYQSENPFEPGDSFSMDPLYSYAVGASPKWWNNDIYWTYGHIDSFRIKLKKSSSATDDVQVYLFGYGGRFLGHITVASSTLSTTVWTTIAIPVDKDVYNEKLTLHVARPQYSAGTIYVGTVDSTTTPPFYEVDWTPLSGTPPERLNANFGRLQGGTFSHQANEPYIKEGLVAGRGFWDENWFQLSSSGPRDPYTYDYVFAGMPPYSYQTNVVATAAYGYALDPSSYFALEDWPGNGGGWGGVATGAKFTTDGGTLQYVRILMRTVGSPTDSLVGKIATTLGGTPFAVSSPVPASKVAPSPMWKFVTFTFPVNTLAAGTYYLWVERTGPESSPDVNHYNVAYSSPSVSWQNSIYSDDTAGDPPTFSEGTANLHFFIPGLQLGFPKWGELRQIVNDVGTTYSPEVPFAIGESPAQPWVWMSNALQTASASNVDPTTGFAGRWYWATVWDYRQLLGGPYTLRGQAGDTFHAMTTVTVDNDVGSPYVRGWVAYYDSDMNFVAEHYGSHWPTPSGGATDYFPVLFSDTFPAGAEYATVGWEAWSDDPANSNTVWKFNPSSQRSSVSGSSLYMDGVPPQGSCWIVSDDPPPGYESKFSCGYLFAEDGSSPWLSFTQNDYYGIYTLWDHDDNPSRVDYPGHTTIDWGTITDHPDIPSEYVWTTVGLPMSKVIMNRNDISFKNEWYYYDPALDGYLVQFSMYADAPATFELVASTWTEYGLYENETHETFVVEHPGDGSWLTREAWFPDTFNKYRDPKTESWHDDRWAVVLFRAKAAAGAQVRVGDVFFSYDFTSRVESDKLTIGVAEWVRGDKGEYVGAKLWLKTGEIA